MHYTTPEISSMSTKVAALHIAFLYSLWARTVTRMYWNLIAINPVLFNFEILRYEFRVKWSKIPVFDLLGRKRVHMLTNDICRLSHIALNLIFFFFVFVFLAACQVN